MSLRVIWQYMDRSVTKKILYGRHMAVYGPVRHQTNIIWTSEASVHIIFFWWRTGPYTAIWLSVPWTICYLWVLNKTLLKIAHMVLIYINIFVRILIFFYWILTTDDIAKLNREQQYIQHSPYIKINVCQMITAINNLYK